MKKLFLMLGFLVPSLVHAQPQGYDPVKIKKLAYSQEWLRLLHYRKKLWGYRSELSGPDFFFSPEGDSNPEAELKAGLEAFDNVNIKKGRFQLHPQCAFPVRYEFIKREFGGFTDVPCKRLDDYIENFKAEGVSLVFSSSFPNNPPSMFGHTFLKINSAKHSDLLDTGVSYAANVSDNENSFAFMWFGLTGGYHGAFAVLPYYNKVNEYINSESRDLWEYELNFNKVESEKLLRHLWELETNSWFDYYFFDKNCSYQILTAMEVVKPEWNLSDWGFHVIPGDTTKEFARYPGAVRKVTFRPALRKKLVQRYEAMNANESDEFFSIIKKKKDPAEVSDALPLDTTVLYFQYMRQKKRGLSSQDDNLFKKTLAQRSKLTVTDEFVEARLAPISESSRPDIGHHPYQLGLNGGIFNNSQTFWELSWKAAFHELLNNDEGYAPFSHVDFPGFSLRYMPGLSKINLEKVWVFSTYSLFPLSFLEKLPSWALSASVVSPKDYGCLECHAAQLDMMAGATLNLFSKKSIIYSLVGARVEGSDSFARGIRYGPSALVALLTNPTKELKFKLEARVNGDMDQTSRAARYCVLSGDASYSLGQSFDVRADWQQIQPDLGGTVVYQEIKINLNYYFR